MIIGLTGGIASGKSTVSSILKEKEFKIYDADIIAKEIMKKKEVIHSLIEIFGDEVYKNGSLNREYIKKIVFNNKEKLNELNNLVHTEVFNYYKKIKSKVKKEDKVIFDIPLLFETKMDTLCDMTIVVAIDLDKQIERVMKRDNISKELAIKIINSQMSLKDKIKRADIVLENNGTLDELKQNIDNIMININWKDNFYEDCSTSRKYGKILLCYKGRG